VAEPWGEFLAGGAIAPAHGVEIYTRDEDLVESVVAFFAAGIAEQAPGAVLATSEHASAITWGLGERGLDSSRLFFLDAHQALDSIYDEGAISLAAFDRVVGGLLDLARRNGTGRLRVFGELVDLVWQRGDMESALLLEQLTEEATASQPIAVLCGYRLDVFDMELQREILPGICNCHSHVLPAHDLPRFNHAVARALTDVLGADQARDVYYVVDRPLRAARVPVAQDALRFVSASFPGEADEVLSAARGYYAAVEAA
jgi:hypothetical protein